MIAYYFALSWRSLWRTPVISLLIMIALGFGMSFALVLFTVDHATNFNPMQHKIDTLYAVQLDNWTDDPTKPFVMSRNFIPTAVSYRDAKAILNSPVPERITLLSKSGTMVENPNKPTQLAERHAAYLVTRDFFPMFDVAFKYGGPWEEQNVFTGIHKVVLSDWLNQKFFDGQNSVGQLLLLNNIPYTVSGILKQDWHMAPRIYDPTINILGSSMSLYFPLEDFTLYNYERWGNNFIWQDPPGNEHETILNSEILWLQPWVELKSPDDREKMIAYLKGYIDTEKTNGRFIRSNTALLHNSSEWMKVSSGYQDFAEYILAILFLVVCTTNALSLMLTKFLQTTGDAAVRRALGASRWSIFFQHLMEALLISSGGATIAILLAQYWLVLLKKFLSSWDNQYFSEFAHFNSFSFVVIFVLVAGGCLLTGALPAWRVSRMQPSFYLNAE